MQHPTQPADTIPSSTLDRRKIQILLWMIPVLAWILLLFVFTRENTAQMVPLFSSHNSEEISQVENYLHLHGIDYDVVEKDTICIEKNERDQIQQYLISLGLIKNQEVINFAKNQPDNLTVQ